jgi:hypothetical protein
LLGSFFRFHERAAAKFHIQHQAIETFRELLAPDTGNEERLRRDRASHIAQRVKLLSAGDRCLRSGRSSILCGEPSGYFSTRSLRIIASVR